MTDQTISRYNRQSFAGGSDFTYIGDGEPGGKAQGLALVHEKLAKRFAEPFREIIVNIPRLTVITTDFFGQFISENGLDITAFAKMSDERIAHHFQKASLPAKLTGDLHQLITHAHSPLAIRSSSLLEDALRSPYAGIYATKMIANNQPEITTRFRKLTEAIKFVYASTYFKAARDYACATGHDIIGERMAVIIQEIVGLRHGDRFYPNLSGVARSYNFYPTGHARSQDGVVNLALGLGKTIVDGGRCWTYSPAYPRAVPPFNSINDLLKQTQTDFWAVQMGKISSYDPISEAEYLVCSGLKEAEYDNTIRHLASTYDCQSDRIQPGTGTVGPRIINFAPILQLDMIALNPLLKELLACCEECIEAKVEIEFAVTIGPKRNDATRLGLLQIRPMAVSDETITIDDAELHQTNVLLASDKVLGNGVIDDIHDVVYLKPDRFELAHSQKIVAELDRVNSDLLARQCRYLLIGFGRWGSSDPWLGVPVNWGQISGARVIVESTLPGAYVDLSQGSHFFHNLANLRVCYFSLSHVGEYQIDWDWLKRQPSECETEFVRHVQLTSPLHIKVDGRNSKGVIVYGK